MNTKLNLTTLALTVCVAFFASTPPVFSQTPSPSASPPRAMQMQDMNQMAGMEKMSESMTKMSEMCMRMMQSEKAAMPYIIGIFVLFGLLLFIALVLLIVLEIQWIKYWSRILKRTAVE